MNKIIKHNKIENLDNTKILLYYKQYTKKDNISNTKCSKCTSKVLKTKKKSARAIKKIQTKNVRLAMYGLY